MTTNLKKITSAILTTFMLTSISANAAEGVIENIDINEIITISDIPEDMPVQEEVTDEPIVHTEVITHELRDDEIIENATISDDLSVSTDDGTAEIMAATTLTDANWQTLYGDYFGDTYFYPTDKVKSGLSISGKSNRVRIQETDLTLKGKNGLDLNITRVHDNQELDHVHFPANGMTDVSNTRWTYSFNTNTGESINIGFNSKDELYTYAINGFSISQLSDEYYGENRDVYYYRFEELYENVTEQGENTIDLTYNSSVNVLMVQEDFEDLSCILEAYKLLPNKNTISGDWSFIFPEAYMFRIAYDTDSTTRNAELVGTFRDINGNIHSFDGYERLDRSSSTADWIYRSSFSYVDNAFLDFELFFNTQFLENEIAYNFVIYDNRGYTYYMFDTTRDTFSSTLPKKHNIFGVAVEDKYGNMIQYHYNEDFSAITKIIDTYGREVNISSLESGIKTVSYNENGQIKTITYTSSTLPPEALDNNSPIKRKNVNRLTVTNEKGEQTIYDSRDTEVLEYYSAGKPADIEGIAYPGEASAETNFGSNIERIIYPTGAETHFEYKNIYLFNGSTRVVSGRYALYATYDKINSDIYNERTYTYTNTTSSYIASTSVCATEKNISSGTKTVNNYNYNGLCISTKTTPINATTPFIEVTNTYNTYSRLTKQVINDNNIVTTNNYNPKGRFPGLLSAEEYENKRIYYTYHLDTDMLKSKLIRAGTAWDIDYQTTTTLTPDEKSIEYTTVTKNSVPVAQTKYSYDEYGELTGTRDWVSDTDSDSAVSDGDSFINMTKSYSLNDDTTLNVTNTAKNVINADNTNIGDISMTYKYDIHGNPVSETDPAGNITTIEYDPIGRPVKYTFEDDSYRTIEYNTAGMYTIATDETGGKIKYTYDALGNVKTKSYFENNTWVVFEEYEYDNVERVSEFTKYIDTNLSMTEKYTYDIFDRIVSKEVYSNQTLKFTENYEYTYNKTSSQKIVTKTVVANGVTVASQKDYYDKFGNVLKTEMIGTDTTLTTTATYDYENRPLTQTDSNGNKTKYEYDWRGNVTKVTNALNKSSTAEYDKLGRKIKETNANGKTTEYTYDALDRLLVTTTPFSTDTTTKTKNYYSSLSNLASQKLQNNAVGETESYRTINYSYDNRNRVSAVSGDTTPVEYTYDNTGRILTQKVGTQNPSVTGYTYDSRGNLTRETDALGNYESYTYDIAGNVKTSTDKNGNVTNNIYDIFGLTQSTTTGTNDTFEKYIYEYNPIGQQITVKKSTTENVFDDIINYTYDEFGRVTNIDNQDLSSESVIDNGYEVNYTYDANSNVTATTIVDDDEITLESITYQYNKLNLLTQADMDGKILTYTYDNVGNMLTKTIGSVTTQISYNDANLPTTMSNSKDEVIYNNYSYGYSLDGNRITDNDLANSLSKSYTYDSHGRLSQEIQSGTNGFTQNYAYDDRGNRISTTKGAITTQYSYDLNNRIISETELNSGIIKKYINYEYNEDINQTSKMTTEVTGVGEEQTENITALEFYDFSPTNQLISYTDGGTIAYYKYNADGTRKCKTVDEWQVGVESTYFVWNGANLAAEMAGNVTNKYYYGIDGIVGANLNGTDKFYLKNAHGDVVGSTDTTGTLLQNNTYDAFGNRLTTNPDPFGYCGEYMDAETGNIYLRNRYYDPQTARFITEDPIRDGLNWYVYHDSNPINHSNYYCLIKSYDIFNDNLMTTKNGMGLWISDKFRNFVNESIASSKYYSVENNLSDNYSSIVFNQLYTYGTGAAKKYQKIYADGNTINCYAYVIGADTHLNPGGENAIDFKKPLSVDAIASYVISDLEKMGRSARIISSSSAIYKNERRIAVRVGTEPYRTNNYDYHFMMQNSDGTWSEKHGDSSDSIKHDIGMNPNNILWTLNGRTQYYDSEIIYLAITD